jgi:hypothetical protein
MLMKHLVLLFWLICAAYEFGATGRAYGHGFAGARFFPATLSTVADALGHLFGPSHGFFRALEPRASEWIGAIAFNCRKLNPSIARRLGFSNHHSVW